jgi:hypothetical protein
MLKDRKDIYTRKGRAYIFGPDFSYGRPAQIFLTAPTGEWPTMVRRESSRCPGNKSDGWRWSESVKPIVKTEYCEAPHVSYHVSGRLRIRMADGTEQEFGPGDVGVVPPGHDAWVVGNEPVVVVDISGMKEYAKPTVRKVIKKARKVKGKKNR